MPEPKETKTGRKSIITSATNRIDHITENVKDAKEEIKPFKESIKNLHDELGTPLKRLKNTARTIVNALFEVMLGNGIDNLSRVYSVNGNGRQTGANKHQMEYKNQFDAVVQSSNRQKNQQEQNFDNKGKKNALNKNLKESDQKKDRKESNQKKELSEEKQHNPGKRKNTKENKKNGELEEKKPTTQTFKGKIERLGKKLEKPLERLPKKSNVLSTVKEGVTKFIKKKIAKSMEKITHQPGIATYAMSAIKAQNLNISSNKQL